MKKDFFNGKVRGQYTGYMRTALIFVACMFLCAAILFLCMVLFTKKMDADMRIILYVFADVLFVLTAVFPVVTVSIEL